MGKNSKYETHLFSGVVVIQNLSGQYLPKQDAKPNFWRTGKHTKGHFTTIGQVFLTENGQAVAVLSMQQLAFNQRHNYTPLQRWTSASVDMQYLNQWLT